MFSEDAIRLKRSQILPGVTLITCRTDRFKVGSFSLSFVLPPDRTLAPARSLLLSVLKRGNAAYPTLADINKRLDELYATPYYLLNTTRGGYHTVGFGADLLDQAYLPEGQDLFGDVLSLMGQMLFHPLTDEGGLLTERYVQAEKDNTVDAIRSMENHPAAYAMAQFCEHFYKDEPRGQLLCGNEEQVRTLTAEQLTRLWQEMLACAPIRCFYVGSLAEEQVAERLREMLEPELMRFGRRADIPMPSRYEPCLPRMGETVARVEQEMSVGQSHLILGFRSGVTLTSPHFFAMMLCHEILGLSPISRLFVHVREKHGICYSCSSEYHIDRGDLTVCCGINAKNRDIAERAILAQIEVMRTGAFTDAELEAARRSLENSYKQIADSTRSIVRFYDLRAMLHLDQTVAECRRAFASLTREQVMEAAETLRLDTVYFQRGTLDVPEDIRSQEDDGYEF